MDLAIKITFEIGQDFQPERVIGGAFKRDPEGRPSGWGGAFKIPELFETVGVSFELNGREEIPYTALEAMIGKELLYLRYVAAEKEDGSRQYYNYDRFAPPGREEDLETKFLNDVDQGYTKGYRPELITQGDGAPASRDMPSGHPSAGGSGTTAPPKETSNLGPSPGSSKRDFFPDDLRRDDLPF